MPLPRWLVFSASSSSLNFFWTETALPLLQPLKRSLIAFLLYYLHITLLLVSVAFRIGWDRKGMRHDMQLFIGRSSRVEQNNLLFTGMSLGLSVTIY